MGRGWVRRWHVAGGGAVRHDGRGMLLTCRLSYKGGMQNGWGGFVLCERDGGEMVHCSEGLGANL